jgi:ATP-binding cassette, subfamily B, bacterial
MSTTSPTIMDLKPTLSKNRLVGLWRMMSGYQLIYIGATVCQGIAASSKTLTYLLLKYFIDQVLTPRHYEMVPWIALSFVGLAVIEGGCSFLSGTLAARTAEGVARRLRNYLFDHIQRLTFKYHSETPTGELIQRCTSDVDAVRRFFADQAIGVGRIILLFIINFAAILFLNSRLAFISIIAIPIILAISTYFFKKITRVYEAYQEQEANLSNVLQENLTGVRVVKAYARQPFEMDKFEKENAEKYKRGKSMAMMHSIFWPLSDMICGAQMLGGFVIGALMAIHGEITIGTYLAYAGLVVWIIFPMRNLGRVIVQTSTGLVSYSRVVKIIKEDREDLDEGDVTSDIQINGRISFDRVGFEYDKGNPILKDISFTCEPGQAIALLGSTGSGKTSLVNLLPRFYDPTSGIITLDGLDLQSYSRRVLRQQIGIVEQEPFLFSRSIRDNITYGVGRDVPDEEVYEASRAAAIHDVILSFPEGYKTLVGEKGVTLSGGQKQRVAIARTLLKDPRILILDDSTSSVDMETEAEIRAALQNLMKNRTTFIIAHRIQSIMNADLILVFDKGEIIERGTHADLLQLNGMYRKIYDLQTRIDTELEEEIQRVRL